MQDPVEKKYTNEDITVKWLPHLCIHSTICWKGLNKVFNPREKPWVKMDGATTEMIVEQVRKCPSGALSYSWNREQAGMEQKDVISEAAHIMKITVTADGPYVVNTECLIIHSDGREELRKGSVSLCRCGLSSTKPYCDGSHTKGFRE